MTLKIKICGLSTLEHIDMVIKSRVDMAGFIFANPSPREINPSIAKELSFATAAKSLDRVAVFVDASNAFIEEAINSIDATFIQLHGNETVERCLEIKSLTGLPVIKSIGILDKRDIKVTQEYKNSVDYFLFDAKPDNNSTSQRGGLNKVFDWSILDDWSGPSYFLSGGLNINNVSEAIKRSDASVIDVSSGVEIKAGVKDRKKIEDFVQITRSAYGNKYE